MTLALYARRARNRVVDDLDAAIERDPAATSRMDVALNAPGLHAIWAYRFAHRLWLRGGWTKPVARLVMTVVRSVTGVEIHPGRHGQPAELLAVAKAFIGLQEARFRRCKALRNWSFKAAFGGLA